MYTRSLAALAVLAACSGSADSDTAPSSDARTLASCETDTSNAPVFYATWFRCVSASSSTDGVTLQTHSLPPHPSYYYGEGDPNYAAFDDTRGSDYHPNPNTLTSQLIAITIPDDPTPRGLTIDASLVDGTVGTSTDEYPMGAVGVALDSVAIFNALAAPGDDIAAERFTFDDYNAHPAPDGTYHYHTDSKGPLEVLASIGAVTTTVPGQADVELYGVMCDGTVLLGCTELDGSPVDGASLDAQGGHVADLKQSDGTVAFANRYHTHICEDSAHGNAYTPEIQYYDACSR